MGKNSQQNESLPKNISSMYPNDGEPLYDVMTNSKGLKLYSYKWRVNDPVAIIIGIHGIQSHCRFEFLSHPATSLESLQLCTYQGSWVNIFNENKMTFCGFDLQSHGFSEGWKGDRCNIEFFEDFIDDVIFYIKKVADQENDFLGSTKPLPPIYIMGLSLGGCIVLRAIEKLAAMNDELILSSHTEKDKSPNQTSQAIIAGCISLAPMLSLENAKKQIAARLFLGVLDFAAKVLPHLKVAAVSGNTMYPTIEQAKKQDPLVIYPSRIPMRMSSELLKGLNKTQTDAQYIPDYMKILFVHSINDTQCEPEGSQKFYDQLINNHNKSLWKLTSFWHNLTHETGTKDLADSIIAWISTENPTECTPLVSKL